MPGCAVRLTEVDVLRPHDLVYWNKSMVSSTYPELKHAKQQCEIAPCFYLKTSRLHLLVPEGYPKGPSN